MRLTRVTITGADDSVNARQLFELSRRFPFVEWGILFSRRQVGTPRFPSARWTETQIDPLRAAGVALAAHLCGGYVREFAFANNPWAEDHAAIVPAFRRVQLNFHAEPHVVSGFRGVIAAAAPHHDGFRQFIVQIDGVNDPALKSLALSLPPDRVVPLFDLSGGAGVLPDAWPTAWLESACGYAGGLGPDNVVEQIRRIEGVTGADQEVWIDMERRVRTDDDARLDLDKVRAVLVAVEPFIAPAVQS